MASLKLVDVPLSWLLPQEKFFRCFLNLLIASLVELVNLLFQWMTQRYIQQQSFYGRFPPCGFPQQFPPLVALLGILPFQTTLSYASLSHLPPHMTCFSSPSHHHHSVTHVPAISTCSASQRQTPNPSPFSPLSSALGIVPQRYTTHPSYHPHLRPLQSCTLL